ncbi:hypothetical protein L873DRAFT_1797013 [Choiromyces venosus 120613-1]|uniref:Nucleoporin Nup159/Nup146 N-terminal domain-containing protein n=1 Tax=Choiromyces venosus 120613-1 TaxID=1336337 RepID=A0A3N4K6A5_9PEZI|nr:hypothetical protein L873DRAFT_1797013 [Choiromyces venosus 120613-1]
MAFGDSNPFGALATGSQGEQPQAQLAGENEPMEVVVENLGFLGLNGETKVKLFAQGYDTDSVPTSSASLFAIANKRGLFAAATFSNLIVGGTSSLREAFTNTSEKIAPYNSRISLSLPTNISHVAFTVDESHLVLGSSSGGLAIYLVNDFSSAGGDLKPVFELGTDGISLREVKPNPEVPELVAIVTSAGEVRMINISTRDFEKNSNGDVVLKNEASTVSWSQRGKQIVCGMGDGTGWQMTPQGEVKAVLPSVPGLKNHFISSIVWVENDSFITTHTPVPSDDANNESVFHALTRSGTSYTYMKLPDPVPPFGMDSRTPPYFFHTMIRQYAPGIKDTIIFTNTCSSDVGLVCRFSTALTSDPPVPADSWFTANIGDDPRRAQIPLSDESLSDTSPIGMALDLSNKANVKRPVGGEEIEESPGPLPILMVLNHEGLLSAWNVIYNDAIEQGEKYSGMMVYAAQEGPSQSAPQTPQQPAPQRQPVQNITPGPAFGVSSFGQSPASNGNGAFGQSPNLGSSSPFGKPATGAFGQPAATPAFAQPSSIGASGASAFGKPGLGGSMWGSASGASPSPTAPTSGTAFGQPSALGTRPAFGQPAALGAQPAFGQTAALGVKPAFGQPAPLGSATPAPAFGAPTLIGANKPGATGFGAVSSLGSPPAGGSPFGSASAFGGGNAFGAYANKGGFSAAVAAGSGNNSKPIWGTGKSLGSDNTPTAFGGGNNAPSPFGSGSTDSFKISSAFKPEPTSATENKPSSSSGSFGSFGMGLEDALTSAPSAVSRPGPTTSLPTPKGVSDQNIRDAIMDDSDEQPDEPSDDDDIISPGAAKARQAGFTSTLPKPGLPSGIFSSTKAANSSPSANSPFTSVNQSSSPFSSVPGPSSGSPFSAWGTQAKTPFGAPSTPPPKSPFSATPKLSSPFGAPSRPLTFAQSPEKGPESAQPVAAALVTSSPSPPPLPPPPSFASVEKVPEALPALPADKSSKSALSEETSSIPLPPDPKSVRESDDTRAEELPSLSPSGPKSVRPGNEQVTSLDGSDDDNDGNQEIKEEDEEGEGDNEGEGDDEEEDEDEDGDDDDDYSEGDDTLPSGGFVYEPKPKLPSASSSPSTSNVFGADTTFKETFSGGIEKDAPFSLFATKPPPASGRDNDRSGNSLLAGLNLKSRSPSATIGTLATKNKEKKSSPLGRGGMFNRPPKKPDVSRVLHAPPPPKFVASGSKPQGTPPFYPPATPAPDDLLPSTNKPARSSPLATSALQAKQTSQKEEEEEEIAEEEEIVESDLDFDKEYDDYDPERIRNKVLNIDVKPVQELPKFRRNREVEVASDFDAVFDSIYLSGNMMVNRLGLTVQGLKAYHLGQESPLPDVEHKAPKDMKQHQDWRFCEMNQVKGILEQLLASVRNENQGNDELEAKYQAASKGFIKLDIKDAEIQRLLAVHNDAQAAAIARARPLTPEQVLQQRKLRKEYAKVERLLKEAEKEVTQLKAKIASRDRGEPGAVVPPTVEAVKNTIMKLTGMVERKNGDIDCLEERLKRVKIKSRSVSATPSRSRGLTPDRTLRGETPQIFETPEKLRSYDHNISNASYLASPVLALADPLDVEEAREKIRARKEMGKKLRNALERCGPKLTVSK